MRLPFYYRITEGIRKNRVTTFSDNVNRGREVAGIDPATEQIRKIWFCIGGKTAVHG